MTGRFIAVVGPSGVGKDSVMRALAARDRRFLLARRVITRPADAGGEDFDGVGEAEFETMRARGDFALWWRAHGLHYGIPRSVDERLAAGHYVLANLSRSVLPEAQVRFRHFDACLLTASRDALAARLQARGRESADEIAERLLRATFTVPRGVDPFVVDNSGALDACVDDVLACLQIGARAPKPPVSASWCS